MMIPRKLLSASLTVVILFVGGFFLGEQLSLHSSLSVDNVNALAAVRETSMPWIAGAGFLATLVLGIFFFIFTDRRSFEPQIIIGTDEETENAASYAAHFYVREARQAGFDDAVIRAELVKVGWREGDIEKAFANYE
ncbi:hypothetical protein HY504_03400 [Candidatus Wolfebacteria bacterium]|nr:hypothetical protein [Candidatus Wolfebacteria bacterium]